MMIEAALSNDYTSLLRYQREVSIQPVNDPITVPEEEFHPEIPIETKMELQDKLQEKKDSYEEEQEQKEAKTREFIAGYAYIDSKKTQFEILLEGMNPEDDVIDESDSSLRESINILRDIQKQNNVVKAYATYQEGQQNDEISL